MGKVLFHERQYFRQAGIWLMVLATDLVVLLCLVWVLWFDEDKKDANALWAIAGSVLLCLFLTVMLLKTAMETRVTNSAVFCRFTLFQRKPLTIPAREIKRWEVRNIKPLLEYGGYGVKKSRRGTAYLTAGRKALVFVLNDGKKITIGTQKPRLMENAVAQMMNLTR